MGDSRALSYTPPGNKSDKSLSPPHSQSVGSAPAAVLVPKKSPTDFTFIKQIGEGSFSTVYLAREVANGAEYAIKVCEKAHIMRERKQMYVQREKEVLARLNMNPCPYFVKLYCTFQDEQRLYFVMTYARNGELLGYIHKVGCFDCDVVNFYAAEVILALDHLHKFGIIHRDVKPENILLNDEMHILLTDFGSAKILDDENAQEDGRKRRNSFVGTPEYIPPELLTDKQSSKSSDLWALGCLIYQMISGLPPFRAETEFLIFQKIAKLEFAFPEGFDEVGEDLVKKLLEKNPEKRLGAGGMEELMGHGFFAGFDWENVHERTPPQICPFVPHSPIDDTTDSYIPPGFDEERLINEFMGRSPSPSTRKSIITFTEREKRDKLDKQVTDPYNRFVEGNVIVKQGFLEKRKGLFARRRRFLLTTGPHLYYVDPVAMVKKGEIPWSADMSVDLKNFKVFFVHTPNRTYYLEDPEGFAKSWKEAIEDVRDATFKDADAPKR